MDQLILLVVVGVIAFVKWLMENAGQNAPDETQSPPASPLRPGSGDASGTESEEERMRRFMEALGLPQNSMPPPVRKPTPRPADKPASQQLPSPRPHPRQLGRPLPPGRTIFPSTPAHRPDIAPPLETGGPLPTLPKIKSVGESAPSMEVTSIPQMTFAEPEQAVQSAGVAVSVPAKTASRSSPPQQQGISAQAALREQLREPDSIRKAILLREILGAPKGLQSAQSPSIFSSF